MKSRNISILLALASLPFFASCASLETAGIANGLDDKRLSYAQASKAISKGANVKDAFAGKCFLKQAAEQNRRDLIELFIEKGGASAFEAPGGYKHAPFSLFKFAYDKGDTDLALYCLKHPDASPEPMHTQVLSVAKKLFEWMREPGMARWAGERNSEMLEAILQSGILSESEAENLSPERAKQIATQDLFNALERGDSSQADRCVKQGADVNAKNANGDSVLYAALKSKNGSSLRSVLLDAGATLRPEEATEILAEAVTGRLEFDVSTLIQWGADVNAKDKSETPVICLLLKSADTDGRRFRESQGKILSAFINAGVDVNAKDAKGDSALCLFLNSVDMDGYRSRENGTQILSELIKAGADVNTTSADGHSPRYLAQQKNKEWCKILIGAGAKFLPEEIAEFKQIATRGLIAAASKGDFLVVESCVREGADVNAKDANGDSVLCLLLKSVDMDRYHSREYGTKILSELIKAGADVNTTSADGHSPLYLAQLKNNEWCKTLIDSGAKLLPAEATEILAKIVNGKSTYIEVDAPTLIQWGAEPVSAAEATQCLGNTVENGKIRNGLSIELLLQWGADVNGMIKYSSGKEESLLHYASANCKNSEIIAALKRAGAKMTPEETKVVTQKLKERLANAILEKELKVIQECIDSGIDLSSPTDERGGMSWLAFARTIDFACADILEKAGAKMTPEEIEAERRPDGLAAMIGAGNAEGLRRLFAEGVDPNLKIKDDESGEESSLLATAIVWHNMKINPDARGVFECLPEKEEERDAILALLSTTNEEKTKAVIKVIKDAGGKITAEEKKELSLWRLDEMLRGCEWKKIAKAVTEGEIDLSAESNGVNGFHLLADATRSIDSSFINALLNAGADINGKTKQEKRSPLAVAIANMNADAVEIFLRHGANPNDSIPLSGAFGDAGTKSLMDIAIEIYNQAVKWQNSAVARRNNLTSAGTPTMNKKYVRTGRNSGYWADDVGRYNEEQRRLNEDFEDEIRGRNAVIERANETVRIAKKIVSLMAQATGTELTNL